MVSRATSGKGGTWPLSKSTFFLLASGVPRRRKRGRWLCASGKLKSRRPFSIRTGIRTRGAGASRRAKALVKEILLGVFPGILFVSEEGGATGSDIGAPAWMLHVGSSAEGKRADGSAVSPPARCSRPREERQELGGFGSMELTRRATDGPPGRCGRHLTSGGHDSAVMAGAGDSLSSAASSRTPSLTPPLEPSRSLSPHRPSRRRQTRPARMVPLPRPFSRPVHAGARLRKRGHVFGAGTCRRM